ncbi:flagellar protein FlaG [Clostridium magnum]|uniref:Flagellar protein FlaG n=1 Tax=Clostridium magnum DSM 2767 TaxID=1121326 RepID=A0A161Y6T7_9CLOT|nr:flagellar protein FlaG [Clostridium magnum]KZL94059.1 flagellar protein FlaG [Clostridium magnum DSM 2767]SHI01291.1 flagellar protein FlaG [Clostridium magnum DSM 2767]
MEIRNINQAGQSTLPLNVSIPSSPANTQGTVQETIVIGDGAKGSQQNDTYQENSGQKNLTEKEVGKAVDKLNKLLEDKATHAEYEVYGKGKDLIVRIVDNKTKEVVQELPPKQIIDMIDKFCELAGMFVDKKA